jgi:Domain of unknown function (DUF4345)
MLQALRICLMVLGASAVAIALSILTRGAEATATMAEGAFNAISGSRSPMSEHWPPTMDSELRFYAALWGAYGVVLIRAALGLPRSIRQIPGLAVVFFLGGVGRVLSLISLGAPHPFFSLLMIIELSLPLIIGLLWLGARAPQRSL